MAFNRAHLRQFQTISEQKATWQTLPNELKETALTFLSEKELSRIKPTNHEIRGFTDLAIHFNCCLKHPQHLQKNSLSQHLIQALIQNPSLENEEWLNKIQEYFNEKFGQQAVNLLTDYEILYDRLFIPNALPGIRARWIENQEVVREKFYPFITSARWIVRECQHTFTLAKRIKNTYCTVFGLQEHEEKIAEFPTVVPPSLPLRDYVDLMTFLNDALFYEGLWSNVALLNSIVAGHNSQHLIDRRERQTLNSIIINAFQNPRLTENITSSTILYLRNLRPCFFSTNLLIDDPNLFAYFNRLTTEELVFILQYDSGELPENSLVKKAIGKAEIRERFKSEHYIQLAHSPSGSTGYRNATDILAMPEVMAALTDDDLLVIVSRCMDLDILFIMQNNPAFIERMTNLWFELLKNFGKTSLLRGTGAKTICNPLSSDQLRYLVIKNHILDRDNELTGDLLDGGDIYHKLQNALTGEEINYLEISIDDEDSDIPSSFKPRIRQRIRELKPNTNDTIASISPITSYINSQSQRFLLLPSKEWQALRDEVLNYLKQKEKQENAAQKNKLDSKKRRAFMSFSRALKDLLEVLEYTGKLIASDPKTYTKNIETKIIESLKEHIITHLDHLRPEHIVNFQQEAHSSCAHWGWRTIIGAIIGGVIGLVVGTLLGAWAGPITAATALMGGAKGAVIGASLLGASGLIAGAGVGFWSAKNATGSVNKTINELTDVLSTLSLN